MAQALNKTKRRIASVKSTKKITEAMELVATVKLKKFKNKMEANQFYVREIEDIISHLFGVVHADENPYIKQGKGEKNLVVVINSNLGLCASYNSNIYNFVLQNLDKSKDTILTIGIKGELNYEREGFELDKSYSFINEKLDYLEIVKLGRFLHSEFVGGKYKSVKLVYTKYINSLRFEPTLITLFPIVGGEGKAPSVGYEPIYDPDVKTLIDELVPIWLTSSLYQKIIESTVSEQASRRTAMENANDNADELIDKLTIEFNKARQAAITQEILEVVSGQQK